MSPLSLVVGESAGIAAIRDQLSRLLQRIPDGAHRLPPLLILGETGTGKGLLAEVVHRAGPRASGPFVDLNCAAIPDALLEAELFGYERGAFTDARQAKAGLFQTAHRGTLFLDEVGLMPLALQAKLLKAIEERAVRRLGATRPEAVDAWIVAATSEDLPTLVAARRFREDLYHRLAVVTFRLPPLRERGPDIVSLAQHFVERACLDYGLPKKPLGPDARAALLGYPWPGNVRELANAMERVALLSDAPTVTAAALDLPRATGPRTGQRPVGEEPLAPVDEAQERERIVDALQATGGNLSRAAARLGLPRNTLRYRLERLGLRQARPGDRAAEPAPAAPAPLVPGPPEHPGPAAGSPAPGVVVRGSRRVTFLRASLLSPGDEESATETGRVIEAVLDKMRSFGGQVVELDQRSVTAAFGLSPLDDAPWRAAHAALVIRTTLARGRGRGTPQVRLAIHTETVPVASAGESVAVDADAADKARAVVEGLAERMEPGGVIVSASAGAFLRSRFALESIGPQGPDLAYRLVRVAEGEGELARFVGREGELRLLAELFEQARAGQGRAVTIVGEPGIGKSRLLRELRRRLGRIGWLEGRVPSGGQAMPLAPLVDFLIRSLRIDEGDTEAVVTEKLDRRVLRLGEGVRPLLPYLRYLLSLDPGDPAVTTMDSNVRRAAIFDALRRLVFRAADEWPLVLLFEDVHWIDRASEEWLTLVADGLGARRVLLVLTSRPGYTAPFQDRGIHSRIALSALSSADSVRMACHLLAVEDLPEALQRLIADKAEGNPFFVEEIVCALQEVGVLRREADRVILVRPLDEVALPDTVQDVILARIERLQAEHRAILEVASVIGRDVPQDVLQAVVELPEDVVRRGVRQLQAAEFLYEAGLFLDPQVTFKHALTHEVAYARVPAERRRALHARILEAVEHLYAERLSEQAERLAHHALRGEVWAKAVIHCRQAGAKAVARSAHPEAVGHLERALAALDHVPGGLETTGAAIDLRFELRSALIPLGEVGRILGYLREAETLARTAGDRRRLGWVSAYMTIYYLLAGQHRRALEAGQQATELARETDDFGLSVVARGYWGHVFRELGDHTRALHLFGEVVGSLPGERVRETFGQAVPPACYALSMGALSRAALGDIAGAVRMDDEAFRSAEAAERPFGLALASLARAQVLTVRRVPEEARALAERALGLVDTWSLPLWRPWGLAVLGWSHALAGRYREGVRCLEEALQRGEALPYLIGHSLWTIWLGLTLVLAGRFDEAGDRAVMALRLTRDRGERGYQAWAHYLAGEVASRREPSDLVAAETAYRTALDSATPLEMRPLAGYCHAALARVLDRAGRRAEAASHHETAAAAHRALDLRAWPAPGDA